MIHPTKKICASAGSLGFVIVVWSVRSFPTLRNFWPKNGHCVLPLLLLLLLLLFWCERVSYLERASGVVAEGLWYFSTLVIALIFFCVMGHVDRRRQAQGIICCCVLTCKLRRTTPYVLVLFFFFPSHLLSSPFYSLPPSRNSDPGSHSRLFSPPTHYGSYLASFFARRFQLFLPSSTRVELCLPRARRSQPVLH